MLNEHNEFPSVKLVRFLSRTDRAIIGIVVSVTGGIAV